MRGARHFQSALHLAHRYTMKPWSRRLVYLFLLILWLLLISVPFFSVALATRTQLQLGTAQSDHIRLFLIQEKDVEGLGLEITRSVSSSPGCSQTGVRYFMWSGEGENVTYCQCIDAVTGDTLSATPGACSSR